MNCLIILCIIFDVRDDVVNVVGIFHQLENYQNKL